MTNRVAVGGLASIAATAAALWQAIVDLRDDPRLSQVRPWLRSTVALLRSLASMLARRATPVAVAAAARARRLRPLEARRRELAFHAAAVAAAVAVGWIVGHSV